MIVALPAEFFALFPFIQFLNVCMFQMKSTLAFLLIASTIAFLTGCTEPPPREWYTVSQLEKEHEMFKGYEVVKAPDFEGPYKIIQGVFATERRESNTYFHRSVFFDNKDWEFRDAKGTGYGFRVLSVENKEGKRAPIWLRTRDKQDSNFERIQKGEIGNKPPPVKPKESKADESKKDD